MIKLFDIKYPKTLPEFSNLLHGPIVGEFESAFSEYVGLKYGLGFNSATSAIELLMNYLRETEDLKVVKIPSIIPPVVINALTRAKMKYVYEDNVDWVGNTYTFGVQKRERMIVDSAHAINKLKNVNDYAVYIYSFYPTKIVGSFDGGMLCSNDKSLLDHLRVLAYNGIEGESHQAIGSKVYMNSFQAYVAMSNFKRMPEKLTKLYNIRNTYDKVFGLHTSNHLYRIAVKNRDKLRELATKTGIETKIHYKAAHLNPLTSKQSIGLPKSTDTDLTTISIPFHEELTTDEINKVIEFFKPHLL